MKYNKLFKGKLACENQSEVFRYLLSTLKDSIKGWDYFVNWEKALGNVERIEIDLNIMNYLIGKQDIKEEFKGLLRKHPTTYKLIPLLIASRDRDFNILNPKSNNIFNYDFFSFRDKDKLTEEKIEKAAEFADSVGVLKLFENKTLKNVVDYVFGVEVGLDSNGRKNRSGVSMEGLVELFINNLCDKHNYEYIVQATATKIHERWKYHVTVDKSERRFDFAVNNGQALYLIETNYYSGGGSKLKATAGEYKTLYDYIKNDNNHFIWITDGEGWHTASRPLEETFNHTDYILNLDMIEKGLLEDIIINSL